ncbi:MAG: HD domain-containing protein [Armatimonadetes bacterium]|nr:HD domain-containing protein [Armatimonadota bacterium]
MQDRMRSFAIYSWMCFACAAGVTLIVLALAPIVGNPWPSVVWFFLFATLAELLMVSMGEGTRVTRVSPTSPILWAATCVLGPLPAIVVCAVSGVLAAATRCGCFYIARLFPDQTSGDASERTGMRSLSPRFLAITRRLGQDWEQQPILVTAHTVTLYISGLILMVGPSGLIYHVLGGEFLIGAGMHSLKFSQFALPFMGLVVISIFMEHSVYVGAMAAIDPVPGGRGVYAVLLRMKLAWVEDVFPIWRGQLFLIVVALLLSYLYSHIGFWGFVLAIMPVIALRDFFHQYVEERATYVNTITTLATYMQHYHPYTRGHLKRVADLSERVARELKLPVESIRHITTAGFLHDIGKIGVSEEILDKTEKLTDDEWGAIKEHPVKGAEIISHIEFLEGIADWIRYHHKWHNGAGYPTVDIEGSAIPIEAAIIATVDAFDAMTDDRELTLDWKCDSCGYQPANGDKPEACPQCGAAKRRTYRQPKSMDAAIDELRRGAGSQFHPKVVKAFLSMIERDGLHYNVG